MSESLGGLLTEHVIDSVGDRGMRLEAAAVYLAQLLQALGVRLDRGGYSRADHTPTHKL